MDHIRPLCSFRFVKDDGTPDIEKIKKAWHKDNLQWLTIEENRKKGSTWKQDPN